MLLKVLSANAATSTSAEKISGQTNKQTDRQTNKQTNKLEDTSVDVDSRRLTIVKLFKIG